MTFDISNLATDKKMESEGVWCDLPGGLRLKVARIGNTRFRNFVMKKQREFGMAMKMSGKADTDSDALQEFSRDAMARFVLLDWENMVENGEKIPYTLTNAKRLLAEYSEFYSLVEELAGDIDRFRGEEKAETLGNSPTSSDGQTSGAGKKKP